MKLSWSKVLLHKPGWQEVTFQVARRLRPACLPRPSPPPRAARSKRTASDGLPRTADCSGARVRRLPQGRTRENVR